MRIENTNADNIKRNKSVSNKGLGARGFVRTLANPDALASTILLESTVTGGRGVQAYKRGGFPEFRERFTDDLVSAVFWMKGVDIFNKIGNTIGEKVLKLPISEFDVGKDALRTPFKNIVTQTAKDKNLTQETAKELEKKLASFKFGKIICSTIAATAFVGFALPKINQAITRAMMGNKKLREKTLKSGTLKTYQDILNDNNSFESFDKKTSSNKSTSFKGLGLSPDKMATVAHYLENHKICKMLTCDTGILSGRVLTARNADEGREYFFRDAASSFFYFGSTPLVYKLLQKISGSSNLTTLDPVASNTLTQKLLEQVKTSGSIKTEEFAKKTLGSLDDAAKKLIEKMPFKSDVIPFDEFKKYVFDGKILENAAKMSELQPMQEGVRRMLTKQQVCDVFKNTSVANPEFMKKIYEEKFSNLHNPFKYIPMKQITSFRDNIDKYIQGVINTANKSNNGIVDEALLNKINKKSFMMSTGFRIAGMVFSGIILGIVIPKLQYAMTAKRTGSNKAPGLREYESDDKKA